MEYKTVHDLAADGEWESTAIGFKVKGGRVVWENATYTIYSQYSGKVCIGRLAHFPGFRLGVVNRYVDPATPITLVMP